MQEQALQEDGSANMAAPWESTVLARRLDALNSNIMQLEFAMLCAS